jgi:Tol biopolymer transport system component
MNADGTEQTRLTNYPGADAFPNWSPDGQKIVFHRQVFDLEHPGGANQLFIMNADGSDQTQITFPPTTNMFPAWGPGQTRHVPHPGTGPQY